MNRLLVGILVGISITLTLTFLHRTYWLRDYVFNPISFEKIDTSKVSMAQSFLQIKNAQSNYEEKFSSIGKRLDDFLVFGGVVITLLLAITVSVYLKTESEVDKHMKTRRKEIEDELEKNRKSMNDALTEMGGLLANAKVSSDAIAQIQETVSKSPSI